MDQNQEQPYNPVTLDSRAALRDITYGKGVMAFVARIMPACAQELHDQSTTSQRAVKMGWVKHLAELMEQGVWMMNGQAIVIDSSLNVADGQHRLSACSESGLPLLSVLVANLPVNLDVFATIDHTKSRSPSDIAFLAGCKDPIVVGAMAKICFRYYESTTWSQSTSRINPTWIYNRCIQHQADYVRSAELSRKVNSEGKNICPPSATAFAHWLCATVDEDLADDMMAKLGSGANLNPGDPVLALRNMFISMRTNSRGQNVGMNPAFVVSAFVKAFNARRTDRSIKLMRPSGIDFSKRPVPE